MLGDPMNIIMRNRKARMTVDKFIALFCGVALYNASIDLGKSMRSYTYESRTFGAALPSAGC